MHELLEHFVLLLVAAAIDVVLTTNPLAPEECECAYWYVLHQLGLVHSDYYMAQSVKWSVIDTVDAIRDINSPGGVC